MKSYLIKSVLILVILFVSINVSIGKGIKFSHSAWEKVLEKANKENKIIFVDVYATWCGPCKHMSNNIFTLDEVGDYYNKEFVNFKIDAETKEGIEFIKKYKIEAYPTLFYISNKGEIIKKNVGGLDGEHLLQLGKDIIDPENSKINVLTRKYKEGFRDKSFLYEYFTVLSDEGKDYSTVVNEYMDGVQPSELLNDSVFVIFFLTINNMDSQFSKYFAENYSKFELTFGKYVEEKLLKIVEYEVIKAADVKDKSHLLNIRKYIGKILVDDELNEMHKLVEEFYETLVEE